MNLRRLQALTVGSRSDYCAAPASPNPDGNRAQRRAWAKLTKSNTPPVSSSAASTAEGDQLR